MATEIHKHVVRMIWQGYSTLDIVSDLQNRFDILGDEAERELYVKVGQLRKQITEARALAPAAAGQMFRDGLEWCEVTEALSRPYLLPSHEVVGFASKAQEKVQQEQEALP